MFHHAGQLNSFSSGSGHTTNVAVKMLKDNVSHKMLEDFRREVEIIAAFNNENILSLLGVAFVGEKTQAWLLLMKLERVIVNVNVQHIY